MMKIPKYRVGTLVNENGRMGVVIEIKFYHEGNFYYVVRWPDSNKLDGAFPQDLLERFLFEP